MEVSMHFMVSLRWRHGGTRIVRPAQSRVDAVAGSRVQGVQRGNQGAELQEQLEAKESYGFQHLVANFEMDKVKPILD